MIYKDPQIKKWRVSLIADAGDCTKQFRFYVTYDMIRLSLCLVANVGGP